MPNKHTTNVTIKNNTMIADGNDQRNGMTHAKNKYKTKLIFHVNRNRLLSRQKEGKERYRFLINYLINFNGFPGKASNYLI